MEYFSCLVNCNFKYKVVYKNYDGEGGKKFDKGNCCQVDFVVDIVYLFCIIIFKVLLGINDNDVRDMEYFYSIIKIIVIWVDVIWML